MTKEDTYNNYIFDIGNKQWNIPKLKKLLKEILPKNSTFNDFEVQHNFEGIGPKTMLLNARRIVLEGHKTELMLLAIEDITQRKIVDEHKDDFIGIVSHEVRTPLTSIKAFVQILQSHKEQTHHKNDALLLDKISKQVDRMEHMMSTFLNAYSVQTGKLDLQKKDFLIDDLIREVLETFRFSAKTHHIEYKSTTDSKILADRERIGQVVTNLLTNAIKYSPQAEKIIVEAKENDTDLILSVQDFGRGIPKEQQQMIFERFFRVKTKEEESVQGLGLGLYIAYEIIKAHKGKMWVESEVGKGSTFYFSIPLLRKV